MKLQVFGCPNCQQPFQVAETHAGQVVQCPSCAQQVEIPANAFAELQPTVTSVPPAAEQQTYACPDCRGHFGITASMVGYHVGCPHCQSSVLIESPSSSDSTDTPKIVADDAIDKKMKTGRRWKAPKRKSESRDGIAPGSAKRKPSVTRAEPIEPIRRTEPSKPPEELSPPPRQKKQTDQRRDNDSLPPKRRGKQSDTGSPPDPPIAAGVPNRVPPIIRKVNVADQHVADQHAPSAAEIVDREVIESELAGDSSDVTASVEASIPEQQQELKNQLAPIDHLLPPRFDVLDPARMRLNHGKDQFKVLLPDGKGGMKQVDKRVMRVERDGEKFAVVAMTEKERRRRRLIQNIVAIVIGIIIMAIAFSLLL